MEACPSISETILGLIFLDSSSVAHVCRRSWKRICGSGMVEFILGILHMNFAERPFCELR